MKYIFKQVDEYTPSETTVEFTADHISVVLEQFHFFLKGCGFMFDGQVDVVNEEQHYDTQTDWSDHGGGSTLDDYPELKAEILAQQHSKHYFDKDRNK